MMVVCSELGLKTRFTYATSRLLPDNRPLRLSRPGPVIFLRAVVNEERGGSFLS